MECPTIGILSSIIDTHDIVPLQVLLTNDHKLINSLIDTDMTLCSDIDKIRIKLSHINCQY